MLGEDRSMSVIGQRSVEVQQQKLTAFGQTVRRFPIAFAASAFPFRIDSVLTRARS